MLGGKALPFVRGQALKFQTVLAAERTSTGGQISLLCHEVLREIGEDRFSLLEERCKVVAKAWWERGDYLRFAAALLVLANLYRSVGDYRQSFRVLQNAYDIIRGLDRKHDRELVKLGLHQAVVWRHRLVAVHGEEPASNAAKDDIKLLRTLAREVNTPGVWFDTLRAEADHHIALGDFEQAQWQLDRAKHQATLLPPHRPMYTEMRLLQREVELLLGIGSKDLARERALEYGVMAREWPIPYYSLQWERWRERCPELPCVSFSRRYVCALLSGLYFEDRLATASVLVKGV